MKNQSPLKQIRKYCIYCTSGHRKTIRFCHSVDCPNWRLRFGTQPTTFIKANGEKTRQLFDKSNFQKGAKFCPTIATSDYKL